MAMGTQSSTSGPMEFDRKLLELLVCPLTKKPLRYDEATHSLVSDAIATRFPIVDGIPHLLPNTGVPLVNAKPAKPAKPAQH